jgi:hypothetical protein
MRKQFAWHATACVLALVLTLAPRAGAQQRSGQGAGDRDLNPSVGAAQGEGAGQAGQNRSQRNSQNETIRGVIAAITAEGEMTLDYRTNTVARTEGAFVTIVGSPAMSWADAVAHPTAASGNDQRGQSASRRHNIYVAWMSPRTKITQRGHEAGASERNQRRNDSQTEATADSKALTFDQLEVGDHVEVQFSKAEDSNATNNAHQNQQMRQKHGRHRTFVGYATSITMLPESDHDKMNSGHDVKSTDKPKD